MEHQKDGETTTATVVTHSSGKPSDMHLDVSLLNTYRVNGEGKFVYIKYHFLADNGQRQFTADEAQYHGGADPDWSKRDLWQAIEKGEEITYTAHVQIMQPEDADPVKLGFDPFDVTKVWPKKQFPVSLNIPASTGLSGLLIQLSSFMSSVNSSSTRTPRTSTAMLNRRRSPRAAWSPALKTALTLCCNFACSSTAMPSITESASTSTRSR